MSVCGGTVQRVIHLFFGGVFLFVCLCAGERSATDMCTRTHSKKRKARGVKLRAAYEWKRTKGEGGPGREENHTTARLTCACAHRCRENIGHPPAETPLSAKARHVAPPSSRARLPLLFLLLATCPPPGSSSESFCRGGKVGIQHWSAALKMLQPLFLLFAFSVSSSPKDAWRCRGDDSMCVVVWM
jgi:hypothetical protein